MPVVGVPQEVEKAVDREWFDTLTTARDAVGGEVDLTKAAPAAGHLGAGKMGKRLETQNGGGALQTPCAGVHRPHRRVRNKERLYGDVFYFKFSEGTRERTTDRGTLPRKSRETAGNRNVAHIPDP